MEQRHLILTVLFAALISSGCMGGGGEEDTGLDIGPGGKTITVTNYEVQPQSILAGQSTQVKIGIVNTGGMDSQVKVGLEEGEQNQGRNVLVNSCPDIFSVSRFDAESSRIEGKSETYNLEPGDELELSWGLRSTPDNIPLNGYKCPVGFQIPFEYAVNAYQQIEVKRNEEIQGSTSLSSRTSTGPLNINLEMIGSTSEKGSPTFIQGDSMEVLLQMENTAPEESSYQGLVELSAPTIEASEGFEINATSCNFDTVQETGMKSKVDIDETMRLYQGQSRVIRCGVQMDGSLENPSSRGQVTALANYTYIKDLGETEIEVEYRG